METTINRCTKADFDEILSDLPQFWGGKTDREGAPVVRDYSGPSTDRVLFWKDI